MPKKVVQKVVDYPGKLAGRAIHISGCRDITDGP